MPASASVPGWSVTPSPNPVIATGQLFWVSCPDANSCMAVGTYVKAWGAGVTLAERWNGSKWRILPIPSPPGAAFSGLLGVPCVSASVCEAVGATFSRSGVRSALAERWNGTRWQLQPAPAPAGGGYLGGCRAPRLRRAPRSAGRRPARRWRSGGTAAKWRIQSAPGPPGAFVSGVACLSSSACTAVGLSSSGTLAERWNGTRWSIQPTPNPAGAQFTFLNTVACASASDCIAAGAYINSSGAFQTLAEQWNGTRWPSSPHAPWRAA